MAIEIVDFPIKNGGSFHGKMLVHQRVQQFIDVHCILKFGGFASDLFWNLVIESSRFQSAHWNPKPWRGALGWKHLLQTALRISAASGSPICRVSKRGRWRVRWTNGEEDFIICFILFDLEFLQSFLHQILAMSRFHWIIGLWPDFAWEIGDQCGTFLRPRMFSKRCFLLFVFLVYATKLSVIFMILITYPNQPSPNCTT